MHKTFPCFFLQRPRTEYLRLHYSSSSSSYAAAPTVWIESVPTQPLAVALTRTLASVRLVHMAISSRVDMSGYRFLLNVCSSSCSCCDVKCVRCLRWRLFFLSFLGSSAAPPPPPAIESPLSWPGVTTSVLIDASFSDRLLPAGWWLWWLV